MDYDLNEGLFSKVKDVSWEDTLDKLEYESIRNACKVIQKDAEMSPTFVLESTYLPGTIGDAYDEVFDNYTREIFNVDVYVSFTSFSNTFGRHKDINDVLIVGSRGEVIYKFDDGSEALVKPGDALLIREGVYHTPVVLGPRITLSFTTLLNW